MSDELRAGGELSDGDDDSANSHSSESNKSLHHGPSRHSARYPQRIGGHRHSITHDPPEIAASVELHNPNSYITSSVQAGFYNTAFGYVFDLPNPEQREPPAGHAGGRHAGNFEGEYGEAFWSEDVAIQRQPFISAASSQESTDRVVLNSQNLNSRQQTASPRDAVEDWISYTQPTQDSRQTLLPSPLMQPTPEARFRHHTFAHQAAPSQTAAHPQANDNEGEGSSEDGESSSNNSIVAVHSAPEPQSASSAPESSQGLTHHDVAVARLMHHGGDLGSGSMVVGGPLRRRSFDNAGDIPTISVRVPTGIDTAAGSSAASSSQQASRRSKPRRTTSAQRKRKQEEDSADEDNSGGTSVKTDASAQGSPRQRSGSQSQPKSPRLGLAQLDSIETQSQLSSSSSRSNVRGGASGISRRARSRSNASVSLTALDTALAESERLRALGPQGRVTRERLGSDDEEDEDDDDILGQGHGFANIPVPSLPSQTSFRAHILQINPQISQHMLERFVYEQLARFKRLAGLRLAHHQRAVIEGRCQSGVRCRESGEGPQYLVPRTPSRSPDAPAAIFYIVARGSSGEAAPRASDPNSQAASFPTGVPHPPVERLPAVFECSLCFDVITRWKPSDWTKHVHEDLQPFTCTFAECNGEPSSFKRKADWIRHENERHRHLEWWTCSVGDCRHVFYRKHNFVQHLAREHDIHEPRSRSARGVGARSSAAQDENLVARLIVNGHDTTRRPASTEPCCFCGAVSPSWKVATTHLAKHMELLSLPICRMLSSVRPETAGMLEAVDRDLVLARQNLATINVEIPERQTAAGSSAYTTPFLSGNHSPAGGYSVDMPLGILDHPSVAFVATQNPSHPELSSPATPSSGGIWAQQASVHPAMGADVVYRTRSEVIPASLGTTNPTSYPGHYSEEQEQDRYSRIARAMALEQATGRGMATYPPQQQFLGLNSNPGPSEAYPDTPGSVTAATFAGMLGEYAQSPTFYDESGSFPSGMLPSASAHPLGTYANTYPPILMTAGNQAAQMMHGHFFDPSYVSQTLHEHQHQQGQHLQRQTQVQDSSLEQHTGMMAVGEGEEEDGSEDEEEEGEQQGVDDHHDDDGRHGRRQPHYHQHQQQTHGRRRQRPDEGQEQQQQQASSGTEYWHQHQMPDEYYEE